MSTFKEFWDEFQERFSRAPVWLPGTSMRLGEIGIIDRRGYIGLTSLAKHGITFEEQPSDAKPEYYMSSKYASSKDIGLTGSLSEPTGAVGQVSAGMQMTFSADRAFVVRAAHVRGVKIANVLDVEAEIRRRHAIKPFWGKDWIYVQEVVTAGPCIMVVSEASGAQTTVKASGSGPGFSGFAQLFTAGAALQLSGEVSSVQQIVTAERAPFMWRGRWLRGALRKKFVDRGPWDDEATDDELYEDFDDPRVFEREVDERRLRDNSQ